MKKVFIVTCSYRKAYPVIESLKKSGFYIVAGIVNDSNVLFTEALSRYVDRIVSVMNPNISEDAYIASIIRAVKKYDIDIIVPIGFIDFMIISKYRDFLRKFTIVPVESYEKMCYVSNKWALQGLCDKMGIYYPKTIVLKGSEKDSVVRQFIKKMGFPLILKGLSDGSKPMLVSNQNMLMNIIDGLKGEKILQEYIPGFGTGYFCLSYEGEPLAEFMHRRVLEVTPLGGASVKACSYFDEELLKIGRSIIKGLSWTGVLMAEFRKEMETGRYYLLEINPKFWGSLELAYRAGVDFPRYFVEFFLEGKKPDKVSYRDMCFSWMSEGFSSYSKYGFKTLVEVALRLLPKNPLFSDLHIHDPINSMQKIFATGFSILRSTFVKNIIPEFYFNEEFRVILPQIRIVIFDFDGTLVTLAVPWNAIRNKLIKLHLIKNGEGIQEAFYKFKINGDEKSFNYMNEIVKAYELEAVRDIVQDDQLISLVRGLKRLNFRFVVVSKNSKHAIAEALNRLNLLNYIDFFIGREDEVLRANQIARILRGVETSSAIMIGDTISDIKASLQAGVMPCMIANNNIKRLQAENFHVSYAKSVKQVLIYILKHKTQHIIDE
ncbi:MAG: HAD hydrolase-like protein [Candidatus Methanomethylicia archaeon]